MILVVAANQGSGQDNGLTEVLPAVSNCKKASSCVTGFFSCKTLNIVRLHCFELLFASRDFLF